MNMQRIPMPGAEKLGSSNPFAETNKPISKEIEDEANSYFQRIYNHPPHPTLSTDEVLEILKRFMESKSQRERVSVETLPFTLEANVLHHFFIFSSNNFFWLFLN